MEPTQSAHPDPSATPRPWLKWVKVLMDVTWVGSGKVAALGSLFACGVVAARVSEPSEFGVYASAMSMVMLLEGLIGSPCDLAAVRFGSLHQNEPARVDRLLSAAVRIKLLLVVIAAAVVIPGAHLLGPTLFHSQGRVWLGVAIIASALAIMLTRSTLAFLQLHLSFGSYAVIDTLQGLARIVAMIGLAMAGITCANIFVGAHAAGAGLVFLLGLGMIRQPFLFAGWPNRSDLREVIRYVRIMVIISVVGTISVRSDVIIVAAVGSTEMAGQYGAATQISMIATMAAMYAGLFFQPRLVRFAREGKLRRLLWQSQGAGVLVGIAVATIGVFMANWIITIVYGDDYGPASSILRILVIANAIDLLGGPVLMPLVLQFFPRFVLVAEIVTTIMFLFVAPLAVSHFGGVGMATVAVGIRLIKWVVFLSVATRRLNHPLVDST